MTKPCGTESLAVIINNHGAKDDFVASVPVYITDGEIVVPVTKPRAAACVLVPAPLLFQFMSVGSTSRAHILWRV